MTHLLITVALAGALLITLSLLIGTTAAWLSSHRAVIGLRNELVLARAGRIPPPDDSTLLAPHTAPLPQTRTSYVRVQVPWTRRDLGQYDAGLAGIVEHVRGER